MSTKFARFAAVCLVVLNLVGFAGGATFAREARARANPAPSLASSLRVQFVHIATTANINSFWTTIDHPLTNGNPDALIIVTQNWNPGEACACVYDNHPVGVWYTGGKWVIFNMDGAAMPPNAAFNVIIPTAGSNAFVHQATAGNTNGNWTGIDNSLTNGNPNAIVLATPVYNPGGTGGTDNIHNVGVWYTGTQWAIFNQDHAAMPSGAAFNVLVLAEAPGVFVHKATSGNSSANSTLIDNYLLNDNPNAIVFITPNWNPGGVGNTYLDKPIGVWYTGSRWAVFTQDVSDMPANAAFNVLVLVPVSDQFIHTATSGNSVSHSTKIDNALTNGSPNAVVFTTPNWNPGGSGGTYLNHDIGMWYTGGQWRIFNQDIASMPSGAAFNVIVPNPDASVFVHKTAASNSSGDQTFIDYPLTNNNPNAILFIVPSYNPGEVCPCAYEDHPVGVYYASGKWRIFNEDLAAMPADASFNVFVPEAGSKVFVHTTTSGNTYGDWTTLDHPLLDNNPNAVILVTQNWNPGGASGKYNNHPVGVFYSGGKWRIFNEDTADMQTGVSFNVYVAMNSIYLPLMVR